LLVDGAMLRAFVVVCLCLAASACKPDGASDLRQRVEAALRSDPGVAQLSVTERRGIVTLAGVVDTEGDRAHLHDVARSVPGVVAVDDHLVVRSPPVLTAATPEAIVAATLSSRLRAADLRGIDVEARGKTLRIVGQVRSDRHADAVRIVVDNAPREYRVEDALTEVPSG
jgi:hypothetical protein